MQKVKLIVTDIDETLIRPADSSLSKENCAAIREAQQAGIPVTLATGRIYTAARRWVDMLSIGLPVIACNGADIRVGHKTVGNSPVHDDAVREIIGIAQEQGVLKYLFSGDDTWCTPEDYNEALFLKWTNGQTGDLPVVMRDTYGEIFSAVAGNVQKVLLWTRDKKEHRRLMDALAGFGDTCDITCGEALNVEVNRKGVTKARALSEVARLCGVTLQEIMAIGDSGNDVEMLRAAGVSVAVGNAMPEAKAAADHEVAPCRQDGVAEAIRKYALSR